MTNPPSITDVVGLFVFVAAVVFSPDVAAVVGPYMAIIVTASIGASFSLARREKSSRTGAVFFFVRICGLAALLTVGMSVMLAGVHTSLSERALLAPIAFGIGLVGDDWPSVGKWAGGKISSLIDVFSNRGGRP